MTALSISIHKHRRSRIFLHLSTRLFASISQTLLSIIDNQLLAKGIDEMLGSARDNKLIRIGGGKLNGVANLITPEATRGRDHHSVVLALLNAPKGYGIASVHRDKLVEHPVVEHQQHRFVGRVVL